MADYKSNGLMGLSHYRNSRVSQELMEPLYLNIFTVQIALPASLGVTAQDTNLLLEGVKNVSGLETHKMPSAVAEQKYKYANRSFAGARPTNTSIDVKLDFEVNLNYKGTDKPNNFTVKMLRSWCDLVFDPLTGYTGLKKDYIAPYITVTMQDRAGNPFWGWILYDVFPTTALPAPALDYNSDSLYTVSGFTLRCDHWNEVML